MIPHPTGAFQRIETPNGDGSKRIRYVLPGSRLCFPDVTAMTLAQAALAYASAGWHVLPTAPGDIKNPGSVLGGRWQEQSTRDRDQIAAWWERNPGYGIALHVGRSGAVAFDLDAEHLAVIAAAGRPDIADALAGAGAVTGTRRDGDRGHYLFTTEQQLSNSAGAFGRWGEVRGRNGVVIAAPTPHPDAERLGGCYRQIKTGPVSALPDVLRGVLTEAAGEAEPLTYGELEGFLDSCPGGGCGHRDCAHTPKGPAAKFKSKVAEGHSRHDVMCHDALPWAFREAISGCYPARAAFDTLAVAFAAAKPEADRGEFARSARWAAAQALADPGPVHDTDAEGFGGTAPRLWRASELRPGAQPSWVAKGRLPRGAVSLLVGDEGIGKSLLWVWLAAAITTGKAAPEFGIPGREPAEIIVVATEDDWCTTVRPRLEAAGADLARVSVVCTESDGSGAPTFPRDLHLVADARPKPALVVVDAWLDTVPSGLKVRDPQDARKALHPWRELAASTGAAVLLLTHTNRDKSTDARDRYGITGELRKKARMTLFAQAAGEGHLLVGPEKMNTARPLPASKFVIEAVQRFDATEDDDGTVPVLRYVGDSARTAREHVRDGDDGDADEDPRELWLYEHLTLAALADAKVTPASAAKAAKDEKDISRATVYRQLDALKAAGLAESIEGTGFPKTVTWQILGASDLGETTGK